VSNEEFIAAVAAAQTGLSTISSLRVPYADDSNESRIVAASMLRRGVAWRGECRVFLRGSVLPVSDVEETSGRGFPAGLALQTESVS